MQTLLANPPLMGAATAYLYNLHLSPSKTSSLLGIPLSVLEELTRYMDEQTCFSFSSSSSSSDQRLSTYLALADATKPPKQQRISPGSKVSLAIREGVRNQACKGGDVVEAAREKLAELQREGVLSGFIAPLDECQVLEILNGKAHRKADPKGTKALARRKTKRGRRQSEEVADKERRKRKVVVEDESFDDDDDDDDDNDDGDDGYTNIVITAKKRMRTSDDGGSAGRGDDVVITVREE